jgi:hypothetical protein
MTKAQNTACEILDQLVSETKSRLEWRKDIVEPIRAKHTVKNWIHIRRIIQFYINSGKIVRTKDTSEEVYIKKFKEVW